MICCDGCEEWFHGKCVGITMQQGKVMEKQGKEYVCEKCKGIVMVYKSSLSKFATRTSSLKFRLVRIYHKERVFQDHYLH